MTDPLPELDPIAPMPPTMPALRRKSNRTGNLLLAVAGVVAIGGVAFAGGRFTAPTAATTPANGNFGQFPGGSFGPANSQVGRAAPVGAASVTRSAVAACVAR